MLNGSATTATSPWQETQSGRIVVTQCAIESVEGVDPLEQARRPAAISEAAELPQRQNTAGRFRQQGFLFRQLPYITVLVLAISSVAYTNISSQPLVGYWEFLVIVMAVVCIVTQWDGAQDGRARFRLMLIQALHWIAILVTMNIVLLSALRTMLPAPATSLVLLTLLALGTFLAGVSFLSLQICFLGLAMALAVPAIAWLKQSALFLTMAAVLLIGVAVIFWPRRANEQATKSG